MSRMARHATICLMNAPDLLSQALRKARVLLEGETPLNRDCGGLCGAACCQPDEDGLGGMLLFPGEASFYHPMPEGFQIEREDSVVPGGQLLTCEGRCQRQDRPLACRLFPLAILLEEGGEPQLQPDPRAWPVCPLMPSGMMGLSAGFVQAAQEAARVLSQVPEVRAFLIRQTAFLKGLTRPLWEEGEAS